MVLYLVMGPNGPILCKHRYLIEHRLDDEPGRYRAFNEPWASRHAAQFLEMAYPQLKPAAEVQVNDLARGPNDHHLLTFAEDRQ